MDRFTWGIVAGTIALVVLGIAVVLVVRRSPSPADLTTPEGTVRAYVEAIESGRPEDAWNLLGERQQTDVTKDEFIRRATGTYRGGRDGRVAIDAVEVTGASARVDLSRTSSGGGPPIFGPSTYTNRMTARLEQQRGQWRITVPPDEYRYFSERLTVPAPPSVIVITATPPTPSPATPPGGSAGATPTPAR
ncbi:MAG TPA: hypothetical protein VFX49_11945 [Chloroflexota bacterium]|nr:hypothetical protein [Chloroflexota bacterium]